jgi:CheY-like chemotaxis protein
MKKVLIVEDQDDARKMISIALRRTTHKILEATNGVEALNAIRQHSPAVVLLDVVMPGAINGFQVCESIKADVELNKTFVIFLSGLNDKKDFDEARRVGANAYQVKPFRLARLIEIIVNHVELADTFVLEINR